MNALRSRWVLVIASLLFLAGSLSFLDTDRYLFGAWMFVLGSAAFLAHSIADVIAERRSAN